MSYPRSAAAAALAATLGLAGIVSLPAASQAASRVTVTNSQGAAVADADGPTSLTVRASGFQSIKGGFGGVYVAFGWVRDPAGGGWRPSRGGVTGRDYRYVPDSESAKNGGYLRFVAFPGSSTAGEAQAVMSADGSFTVGITVPGPVFDSVDRSGSPVRVDCRAVTCGVVTFGAHGVKNASNETFTPVRFADSAGTPTPATSQPSAATPEAVSPSTVGAGTGTPPTRTGTASRPPGRPKVRAVRSTAAAGKALAFTGSGFDPGEQVLALLDDGEVALGPLVAGTVGEVAGVMAIPLDITGGTHRLRLIGAASGARPSERFPIRAASTDAASTAPVAADVAEVPTAPLIFVGVSGLAFLGGLGLLWSRLRRRRPRSRATRALA